MSDHEMARLSDRLAAAERPSRELDAEIANVLLGLRTQRPADREDRTWAMQGDNSHRWQELPHFTGLYCRLNAADAFWLFGQLLPGWGITLEHMPDRGIYYARLFKPWNGPTEAAISYGGESRHGFAIALCVAIARAKEANHE